MQVDVYLYERTWTFVMLAFATLISSSSVRVRISCATPIAEQTREISFSVPLMSVGDICRSNVVRDLPLRER